MDNFKQQEVVMKLINAHKLSLILVPLIEAVEINKRSGNIEGLRVSDLLSEVIEVGTDIYQTLLAREDEFAIVDSNSVADKLYISLAKSLRNSIVLYNTASLSLMKDEIESLFEEHGAFINKYQNDTPLEVNRTTESAGSKEELLLHATSSLTQIFMPLWTFHTNLYVSGVINEETLVRLNKEASAYMVRVIDKLMDNMSVSQGVLNANFKANSLFICSEMVSNVVHDFNGKLIKNKVMLENYIKSPESVLSKIVPAILANFGVLTGCIDETLTLMSKK